MVPQEDKLLSFSTTLVLYLLLSLLSQHPDPLEVLSLADTKKSKSIAHLRMFISHCEVTCKGEGVSAGGFTKGMVFPLIVHSSTGNQHKT